MRKKIIWHRLVIFIIGVLLIIYLSFIGVGIIYQEDIHNEYNKSIFKMEENLVGYWDMSYYEEKYQLIPDKSRKENQGIINGAQIINEHAYFDGIDDNIKIPDNDNFSISQKGFSVSFWIYVDSFEFENNYNGYVNFMGKGDSYNPPNQEWGFRVYDKESYRSNTISFYVFNISGGLGVGSYINNANEKEWIHVVGTTDGENFTYIYKNGKLEDQDPYSRYNIKPQNGNSNVYIGYRDPSGGYFKGMIDEVMIFNKKLNEEEIEMIYKIQKEKFN